MKYVLILICLILIGVMYYQFQYYPQLSINEATDSDTSISVNGTNEISSRLKPIRNYSAVIQRPLFSTDRRPPHVESKTVVASFNAQELDDLTLFGVVVSKDTTYAIIGNSQSGETEQIKKGRLYRGWRVEDIFSDSVKFVGKEAEYELFLSPNENTKKSGLRSKTTEKPTIEYKSLFKSSRTKSPISIGPSNTQSQTQAKKTPKAREPISEADLERLYQEGGYEYELDGEEELDVDAFLDDFDDEYVDD